MSDASKLLDRARKIVASGHVQVLSARSKPREIYAGGKPRISGTVLDTLSARVRADGIHDVSFYRDVFRCTCHTKPCVHVRAVQLVTSPPGTFDGDGWE